MPQITSTRWTVVLALALIALYDIKSQGSMLATRKASLQANNQLQLQLFSKQPPRFLRQYTPTPIEALDKKVTPCLIDDEEFSHLENSVLESLNETEHGWRRKVRFMMIGAQKSGSTSLYYYMTQHPRIVHPRDKETGCFHLNWDENDPYCEKWYYLKLIEEAEMNITGDFSPGYLYMSYDVIPRVKIAYPWVKLMAILRNPVERAFSQHNMNLKYNKSNMTFSDRVLLELDFLRKTGLLPHWKMNHTKTNTLRDWLDADVDMQAFEEFTGTEGELVLLRYYEKEVGLSLLTQGLYAAKLRHWMSEFPCNRFLVLKTEDIADMTKLDPAIEKIHRHLGVEPVPLHSKEAQNTNKHGKDMDADVRALLEKLYKPYNDQLAPLLGDEWKDPW